MPRLGDSRQALLEALGWHYGDLPIPGAFAQVGHEPFERLVAAALGLAVEPGTAAGAFELLKHSGLVEPQQLAEANPLELDELFSQNRVRLTAKALKPLQKIARWASERDFEADAVAKLSTEFLRESWRSLSGVGPATADSLLLFGLGRSAYPVDRASYRILVRHGWLDPSSDYDEARTTLESIAVDDPSALAQLSLGLEKLGREFCKAAGPRCDRCPLRPLLPDGGPVEES